MSGNTIRLSLPTELPVLPKVESNDDVEMKDKDPEEGEDEDAPESLEGMTFAFSGTFSKKREDLIKIINKNGGACATSITKAVTHVLVADLEGSSQKITKAKEDGKKIVGESFLSKVQSKQTKKEEKSKDKSGRKKPTKKSESDS